MDHLTTFTEKMLRNPKLSFINYYYILDFLLDGDRGSIWVTLETSGLPKQLFIKGGAVYD